MKEQSEAFHPLGTRLHLLLIGKRSREAEWFDFLR